MPQVSNDTGLLPSILDRLLDDAPDVTVKRSRIAFRTYSS